MTKTYSTDEFLLHAEPLEIVDLFWRFKSEIECNHTIKNRINKESNGTIPVTDEEIRQIALKLIKTAKEDDGIIRKSKTKRSKKSSSDGTA
jgi:hypothetical protein